MDTRQLAGILKVDPFTGKLQTGVYPSDRAPKKVTFPSAFVFNTDPYGKPGAHWVAVYYDSKGNGYYFDSYGHSPVVAKIRKFFLAHGKKHKYSTHVVQSLLSNVCGHYCVFVLTRLARGIDFDTIVDFLGKKKPGKYDKLIKCLVTRRYSALPYIKVDCNQCSV